MPAQNLSPSISSIMKKHKPHAVLYLWDSRILQFSCLNDLGDHQLGTGALIVSLGEPVELLEVEDANWRSCKTALIPPGCRHEIRFKNQLVAILHVEPESIDYTNLSAGMRACNWAICYDHIDEQRLIDNMRTIYTYASPLEESHKLVQNVIYGFGYDYPHEEKIDTRIRKIVDLLKAEPANSYSMEEMAAMIDLSPTRFIHLFKEQMGVPMRRFRQSLRMKVVIQSVAAGHSLTEAAIDAGFTDSAHFSRAFRNMFGINPSSIFNKSQVTRFYIQD